MVNNNEQKMELVKAYIGENSHKICGKRGNNAAFLFPVTYSFYRKLDNYAIVNAVIKVLLIIIAFFWKEYSGYVSLINIFVVGAVNTYLFNKFYVNDVIRKVDSIMEKNPNLSYEELKEKCEVEGGVRRPLKIVLIIMGVILVIAFCLGFLSGIINKEEDRNLKCVKQNSTNFNGIQVHDDYYVEFDVKNSKLIANIDFYVSGETYKKLNLTEKDMITISNLVYGSLDGIKDYTQTVRKNHVYYKKEGTGNKTAEEIKSHYESTGYTCTFEE